MNDFEKSFCTQEQKINIYKTSNKYLKFLKKKLVVNWKIDSRKNLIQKASKKVAIATLLMFPEIWLAFYFVGRLQEVESDQSINRSYNQI